MARGRPRHIPRPVYPVTPVNTWGDLPVICTCADVGRLFRCTPEKVQRMAASGELPAFRLGPEWRFRREDMKAYVARQVELTATKGV